MSFTVPNESKKVSCATIIRDTSSPVSPSSTHSVDASESADFRTSAKQKSQESQPSAWREIGSCYKSPLLQTVARKASDAPSGDWCSREGPGPLRQEELLLPGVNIVMTSPSGTSIKAPLGARRSFSHSPRPPISPRTRKPSGEFITCLRRLRTIETEKNINADVGRANADVGPPGLISESSYGESGEGGMKRSGSGELTHALLSPKASSITVTTYTPSPPPPRQTPIITDPAKMLQQTPPFPLLSSVGATLPKNKVITPLRRSRVLKHATPIRSTSDCGFTMDTFASSKATTENEGSSLLVEEGGFFFLGLKNETPTPRTTRTRSEVNEMAKNATVTRMMKKSLLAFVTATNMSDTSADKPRKS